MLNNLINAIRSYGVTFKVWADNKNTIECTSILGKDKAKLLQYLLEKLYKLSTKMIFPYNKYGRYQ